MLLSHEIHDASHFKSVLSLADQALELFVGRYDSSGVLLTKQHDQYNAHFGTDAMLTRAAVFASLHKCWTARRVYLG